MLAGSEPQLEDPYINTADFEVKEKDVQMLNMRRKSVPENTQVDSVHQIFGEVVDETTEDVVALPTKEWTTEDLRSEKLLVHYKMGHLPFAAINQMASRGELQRTLARVGDPMCALCMYGQLTRKAWRTKSPANELAPRAIEKPGDCVSIDQMISPIPGHMAQMKGIPTRERYNAATIFVDHFSDVTYIHLQKTTNAEETIEAKEAFERWAATHNVKISHYHADNVRFAENAYMAHVAKCGQAITFCRVNAHFQNGRAERRIRTLQDLAWTQLLHAKARWPIAITEHLWPYALVNVMNSYNDVSRIGAEKSRIELFSGTDVRPSLRHHHHFGVPVYILDSSIQSGKKIPKWMPRARVGIYVGKWLRHARSVSLVLNPRTGLVSPQYHCKYHDTFETVRGKKSVASAKPVLHPRGPRLRLRLQARRYRLNGKMFRYRKYSTKN
jgi:hypothetical protein